MSWFYFKTLREKEFVMKSLRKGSGIPFLKYFMYRLRLSDFFFLHRKWYRMRVYYAPYAFWLWTHERVEKDEELFFESFLKEGDTVIDCGAHLGTLAVIASKKVGHSGRVYAYEAHPRTYSYLERTLDDNGCHAARKECCAIGKEIKKTTITDLYANDLNSVYEEGGTHIVPVRTLDSLLHDVEEISLLKLDIEGGELDALLGGEETLHKTKAVYFESAERSFVKAGYSLPRIAQHLLGHGFVLYRMKGKTRVDVVREGYATKEHYENILAIKE